MKALGVGQCALDLLALVDAYPALDQKVDVEDWERQGGGPTATALVTLSRLGAPSRFVGIVGDDGEGKELVAILSDQGLDVSNLKISQAGKTQLSFIAVERRTGRRTIFCRRSPGLVLGPGDLPVDAFAQASILLLDGAMEEASLAAARLARERGIPVVLDAGRVRSRTLELARECDYVVGSEVFAGQVGWTGRPADLAGIATKLGAPVLTLTFGERGSVTCESGVTFETPAFPVRAVDTTGAGDVFHGAYAFGVLQKWSLPKTIRFASAVAAMKCRHLGGQAGIPELAQVNDFLARSETN